MMSDVLRLHYGYSGWAMARIFDAAERLTPEQLEIPGHAGHGSIRETLVHTLETQWGWFSWFDGSLSIAEAYGLTIERDSMLDVPSIRACWTGFDAQATTLAARLSDDELNAELQLGAPGSPTVPVPLWKLMLHVANHGTQHRSEIATMLTEHDCSPGTLDMLYYVMEQSAPAP